MWCVCTLGTLWCAQAVATHFMVLRQHVRAAGGYEVKTEGDAMFAVFPSVIAAVRAACSAQALPPLSAPSASHCPTPAVTAR